MNQVQAPDALVGAWRLVSWENRAADGQVTHPMGTDVVGYLLYTLDRRFSVLISRADRPTFAAGDLLGGTTQEQARAVEGFVAYGSATAVRATASFTTWSCRCSPTGSAVTSSGGSSWPGTG
jgi:Lipocalin-like domain